MANKIEIGCKTCRYLNSKRDDIPCRVCEDHDQWEVAYTSPDDIDHCPRCGLELKEKEHRPIAGRFEFVEYLECSCGYTEPK